MKSYVFFIILSIILVISVILRIINPIIYCFLIVSFILGIVKYRKEDYDYDYNYDEENPNALISGKNIAGTVYAEYPENTPGLGWIL